MINTALQDTNLNDQFIICNYSDLQKLLTDIYTRAVEANASPAPELLNVEQAAERLQVSKQTVRNYAKRNQLKRYEIGRRILYNLHDLNALLELQAGK